MRFDLNRLCWALIAASYAIDAVLLAIGHCSVSIAGEGLVLAGATVSATVSYIYTKRRPAPPLAQAAYSALLLILMANGIGLQSYLLDSVFNGPLLDQRFAAIDQAMKLDWLALRAWIHQSDVTATVAGLIYISSGPQLLLLLIGLNLAAHFERAEELLAGFASTAFLTVILGALLPAAGAFHWYATPEARSHYVTQYLAVRDGSLRLFDPRMIDGIVQFPSFHAALSVIYLYVVRGLPAVFPVAIAWNLLLILVTPSEGGHYFVDVIAGLMMAVMAIVLIRTLKKRSPAVGR